MMTEKKKMILHEIQYYYCCGSISMDDAEDVGDGGIDYDSHYNGNNNDRNKGVDADVLEMMMKKTTTFLMKKMILIVKMRMRI